MRKACLEMIYEIAKTNRNIFFIGSDLGTGTLQKFKDEMPDRFFMEGISEANVIGMAAGLALEGKTVYVNTIATFITRRCFEQIVIDLCLHNVNVRLIGNGGGLVYAPLGPTHETIEDIAILRAVPNMTILVPADADEMRRLMPLTAKHQGPIYIRLAKGNDPIVTPKDEIFEIGKAVSIREGSDALIITTGVCLCLALEVSERMAEEGKNVAVIHMPTIKPFDKETILEYAQKIPAIITIEEHTILGGLGSAVSEVIAEASFPALKRFKRIGIPDMFPSEYGSQISQMESFGITKYNIIKTISKLMN